MRFIPDQKRKRWNPNPSPYPKGSKVSKYALEGLRTLFIEEHNARVHLVSALIAVALGFVLKISPNEWIALVIVVSLVFIGELFNTSLEALADFASPESIRKSKK